MRAVKYASWPFAESISSLKQAVRIVVISWIGGAKPGVGSCVSSLKVLEYIRRAATTKMSTSVGPQWGDSRQTIACTRGLVRLTNSAMQAWKRIHFSEPSAKIPGSNACEI